MADSAFVSIHCIHKRAAPPALVTGRRDIRPRTMTQLLRFPASVKQDPAIETWMREHPGEFGVIARHWFEVMRKCGEDVRELLHDGHPTACVADAAFAYVNAFRAHVNVGFFRGAEIPDPQGLLEGTGKFMRHVKLRPGGDLDAASLSKLIDAAYVDMQKRVRMESFPAGSLGPPTGEEP
jgi:hypothetical protein